MGGGGRAQEPLAGGLCSSRGEGRRKVAAAVTNTWSGACSRFIKSDLAGCRGTCRTKCGGGGGGRRQQHLARGNAAEMERGVAGGLMQQLSEGGSNKSSDQHLASSFLVFHQK